MEALFDRVGGEAFFYSLVERFYAGVVGDPLLRPLYPEDLTDPIEHLALFLVQYWGGPPTYNEVRGHPRLRMRHVPFVIGPAERDAWLRHMREAVGHMVDTEGLAEADALELGAYFVMAANSLVNTP
jgi:hemoglobin